MRQRKSFSEDWTFYDRKGYFLGNCLMYMLSHDTEWVYQHPMTRTFSQTMWYIKLNLSHHKAAVDIGRDIHICRRLLLLVGGGAGKS